MLGPIAVSDAALGGKLQRALLGRLLVARGRVVSVDRLVMDLWQTPPDGAVAALRTFVADLRRVLEPGRAPRQAPSVLVTRAPGYALLVEPPATLDAAEFEELVGRAGSGTAGEVLERVDAALALWRGAAYEEFSETAWARAESERLDELRMLAVERRGAALVGLDRAAEAVPGLRAHVAERPLREDAWHLLARALYRSGRQGEALESLREARKTLVDELGVDPGPRLRELETAMLVQDPALDADRPRVVAAQGPEPGRVSRVAGGSGRVSGAARGSGRVFVGREDELAVVQAAAAEVQQRGRAGVVLVTGEAGAGKSAFAEEAVRRLGWPSVWARGPEHEGAPMLWPVLPEAGGGPLLVVADDVHHADGDGLEALSVVIERATALIVATYRPGEVGPAAAGMLARWAKAEPVRIRLGGLGEGDVGALVTAVAGPAVDTDAVRDIHRRSGGNPFFVRELARLVDTGERIPDGVRDVIRYRLARLPEFAQDMLRRAAVLGRDVDPDMLAALAGDVLDAVDVALGAGFLTEAGGLRFTHILVRDTLYDDLSELRRQRWHAEAAVVIERARPGDHALLAHHYGRAGSAHAVRATAHAAAGAASAESRNNPHEAARLWRQAVAGASSPASRVAALVGLGRALAVLGQLGESRALRVRAVEAAAGDPSLVAEALAGFDVPAVWPRNDDEELSARIVAAVEGALPGTEGALRARLLCVLALELRGEVGDRGRRAAASAERLARAAGDPGLVVLALNARFMHGCARSGLAGERDAIGASLVSVAGRHGLVTFEVLGHLIRMQSACAFGDFVAAAEHADAADRLADEYELPAVGTFTGLARALAVAVSGGDAEALYREAFARLATGGMPGVSEGLEALTRLALGGSPRAGEMQRPRGSDSLDVARGVMSLAVPRGVGSPDVALGVDSLDFALGEDPLGVALGPYAPWARPWLLVRAGRTAEAAAALHAVPESPHDLLLEARLALLARAAVALKDRAACARLHEALLPAAGQLAGAASGVLSFGPVDDILARLNEHR